MRVWGAGRVFARLRSSERLEENGYAHESEKTPCDPAKRGMECCARTEMVLRVSQE